MRVGVIGAGSPSMAGVLASLWLDKQAQVSSGFKFVYQRNEEEIPVKSKVYQVDSKSARLEFMATVGISPVQIEPIVIKEFLEFKELSSIFKEYV